MSDGADERRAEMLDAWERQAGGWGRQADQIRAAGMPVSVRMLELARLQAGERVLELAAGPGDTGFLAAEQVGRAGWLISSDAVEPMLEVARERAAEQGITNVEFRQLQLEWIDLPTADVDAILCRWGLMLCLDPSAALSECRRVLRPGGRAAFAVWDVPAENPWMTIPRGVLDDLGLVEATAPDGPGPFALAAPGELVQRLAEAGFLEVAAEPVAIAHHYRTPLELIGETVDCSMGFGGVWRQLDDGDRARVREEIERRLAPYAEPGGGFVVPGRSLVGFGEA